MLFSIFCFKYEKIQTYSFNGCKSVIIRYIGKIYGYFLVKRFT